MANSAIQLPSPTVASGQHLDTYRNKLINGNFLFWQRGTPSAAPPVPALTRIYHADRWFWGIDTDGGIFNGIGPPGVGMQRAEFAVGQTDVPTDSRFYVEWEVNSVSGTSGSAVSRLVQRIEDVRTLENQRVTVSFWAKGSGPGDIYFLMQQFLGPGNPGNTQFAGQLVTLTTSWKRYVITFDTPSLAGQTVTAGDGLGSLRLKFYNVFEGVFAGYGGLISIADVQIEAGEVVDPVFEVLPRETIVALCQRFYQQSYNTGVFNGTPTNVGCYGFEASAIAGGHANSVEFPTTMRQSGGSISIWDTAGVPNQANKFVGPPLFTDVSVVAVGNIGFVFSYGFGIPATDDLSYQFQWTADAEN